MEHQSKNQSKNQSKSQSEYQLNDWLEITWLRWSRRSRLISSADVTKSKSRITKTDINEMCPERNSKRAKKLQELHNPSALRLNYKAKFYPNAPMPKRHQKNSSAVIVTKFANGNLIWNGMNWPTLKIASNVVSATKRSVDQTTDVSTNEASTCSEQRPRPYHAASYLQFLFSWKKLQGGILNHHLCISTRK